MFVEKKVGTKKWSIRGAEGSWAMGRTFPAKWKAEIARQVVEKGGKWKDYTKAIKRQRPPARVPSRALGIVQGLFDQICALNPTPEEIVSFGEENEGCHGLVSIMLRESCFKPNLHNTWMKKWGGRVHIDIGVGWYHIMLDKFTAPYFVEHVQAMRQSAGK